MDSTAARLTVMIAMGVLAGTPLVAGTLPSRASLAGISAIGQVVLSAEGRSSEEAAALRQVVEKRLESGGIALDRSLDSWLVASVTRTRDRSSAGVQHFVYVVRLSLQEPARAARAPRMVFRAITWHSEWIITRFGADVGIEDLEDALDARVTHFLRDREAESQVSMQGSESR
jgi:hypothetical protein